MLQPRAYWSRRTELLGLSLIGVLMLANVGIRFWRAWEGRSKGLDCFALGCIAFMIVGIWIVALRHARDLDKLAGQTEERLVARLSNSAFAIGFLGYMMLLEALIH
jgi:hypothetical protein